MTDLIEEAEAMAERLEHGDTIVTSKGFPVGTIKRSNLEISAAALIRRMIAQMRQDAEYVAVERGGRIGKV